MRASAIFFVILPLCTAGSIAACVGDDPAKVTSAEAGTDGSVAPDAPIVTPDASDAAIAATDSSSDSEAEAAPTRPTVVKVGASGNTGCALLSDGSVWCFGDNGVGAAGVSPPGNVFAPTRVAGLPPASDVVSGQNFNCAIAKGDASVWCWGLNSRGQLGHDPSGDLLCSGGLRCNPTPRKVPGIAAMQVSGGLGVACAVTTTRVVYCWGSDDYAVLRGSSPATIGDSFSPVAIAGLPNLPAQRIVEVSVSRYLTATVCALDGTKQVWCWGSNAQGAAGHQPLTNGDVSCLGVGCNPAPALVLDGAGAPLDGVVHVTAGRAVFATRSDGTLWGWGANTYGALGLGTIDTSNHWTPTQVPGLSGITAVSSDETACAGGPTGLWCWGSGRSLKVTPASEPCPPPPNNTVVCASSPVKMPGVAAVTQVDVSGGPAFVTTPGGVALGWGSNNSGRAGHPQGTAGDDATGANAIPTPLVGLP